MSRKDKLFEKLKRNKQIIFILFLTIILIIFSFVAKTLMSGTKIDKKAKVQSTDPIISDIPISDRYKNSDGVVNEKYNSDMNKWNIERDKFIKKYDGYDISFKKFFDKTKNTFIDLESDENQIYSPLNLYVSYSILSEISSDNSRIELLNLLEQDDIKDLRRSASTLYKAGYINGKSAELKPYNSLWLLDDYNYRISTLDLISDKYNTSIYTGDFGSSVYNNMMKNWLNEKSDSKLSNRRKRIETNNEDIINILSTSYIKDFWSEKFPRENNFVAKFDTGSGEVNADFMSDIFINGYIDEDNFRLTYLDLENIDAKMWLFLPKEDKNVSDVLNNTNFIDLFDNYEKYASDSIISLDIPKFNISSNMDLVDKTRKLGVTDIFDKNKSDFENLLRGGKGLSVSKIYHSVETKIDEDGIDLDFNKKIDVESLYKPGIEVKIIDFSIKKPFIFVITGDDNLPLFTGVINDPSKS